MESFVLTNSDLTGSQGCWISSFTAQIPENG
jgi:hypothetical protein